MPNDPHRSNRRSFGYALAGVSGALVLAAGDAVAKSPASHSDVVPIGSDTLEIAIKKLEALNKPVTLPISSVTSLSSSLTVPPEIHLLFLHPGRIEISAGAILEINSSIIAGLNQIFSPSTASVFLRRSQTVYPEWWGGNGDNATDCTSAINCAIISLSKTGSEAVSRGGVVALQAGVYKVSGSIAIKKSYITLLGSGPNATIIRVTNGQSHGIVVGEAPKATTIAPTITHYPSVINLGIDRTHGPAREITETNSASGIRITNTAHARILDVTITDSYIGTYHACTNSTVMERVFAVRTALGFGANDRFFGHYFDGLQLGPDPTDATKRIPTGTVSTLARGCLVHANALNKEHGNAISFGFLLKGAAESNSSMSAEEIRNLPKGRIQDIWLDECETSNLSYGIFIQSHGLEVWDILIDRPVIDTFRVAGIVIAGTQNSAPPFSSPGTSSGLVTITGGWSAPDPDVANLKARKAGLSNVIVQAVLDKSENPVYHSRGVSIVNHQFWGVSQRLLNSPASGLMDCGLLVHHSSNVSATGNQFKSHEYGIRLNRSNLCSLSGNVVFNGLSKQAGTCGIALEAASRNSIVGNIADGADVGYLQFGISLDDLSTFNSVVANSINPAGVTLPYALQNGSTLGDIGSDGYSSGGNYFSGVSTSRLRL